MFKWRLYYENGSTFSDTDGEPWQSPGWGAVAIAQPNQYNAGFFRSILKDGPYFLYRKDWDCWMEVELDGLYDQLAHHAHLISAFRMGRYIRDDDFSDIKKQAKADCELAAGIRRSAEG